MVGTAVDYDVLIIIGVLCDIYQIRKNIFRSDNKTILGDDQLWQTS